MIIVSGKTINPNTIDDQYPLTNLERKIILNMSSSSMNYEYDNLNQFKFEVTLRTKIIEAAREIAHTKLTFKVFRKSYCNEDYWDRTYEGGFRVKDNVKPSDAIKDIYINSYRYGTECATVITIIYYKAILGIYPEKLFNTLFPNLQLMNWHYLNDVIKDIGDMNTIANYLPGDRRYFQNPDVNPLKSEWQGENVIDLGNGTFYGHGIGIRTPDDIVYVLNKYRKPDATQSAYLLNSMGGPNYKYLADLYTKFTE